MWNVLSLKENQFPTNEGRQSKWHSKDLSAFSCEGDWQGPEPI